MTIDDRSEDKHQHLLIQLGLTQNKYRVGQELLLLTQITRASILFFFILFLFALPNASFLHDNSNGTKSFGFPQSYDCIPFSHPGTEQSCCVQSNKKDHSSFFPLGLLRVFEFYGMC